MPILSSNGKIVFKGRLYHLYLDEDLVDVKLSLKNGVIYAHSVVLASESTKLYHLLKCQTGEQKTINLEQYSKEVMRYILEYIYRGIVNYPEDLTSDIKAAAQFLQLQATELLIENKPSSSHKSKVTVEAATSSESVCIWLSDDNNSDSDANSPSKRLRINDPADEGDSTVCEVIELDLESSVDFLTCRTHFDTDTEYVHGADKRGEWLDCNRHQKNNTSGGRQTKLNKTKEADKSNTIPESTSTHSPTDKEHSPLESQQLANSESFISSSCSENSELILVDKLPDESEDMVSSHIATCTDFPEDTENLIFLNKTNDKNSETVDRNLAKTLSQPIKEICLNNPFVNFQEMPRGSISSSNPFGCILNQPDEHIPSTSKESQLHRSSVLLSSREDSVEESNPIACILNQPDEHIPPTSKKSQLHRSNVLLSSREDSVEESNPFGCTLNQPDEHIPSTSKESQLHRSNVLLSSREDSVEESNPFGCTLNHSDEHIPSTSKESQLHRSNVFLSSRAASVEESNPFGCILNQHDEPIPSTSKESQLHRSNVLPSSRENSVEESNPFGCILNQPDERIPSTSKESQLHRSNVLLSSREDSVEESNPFGYILNQPDERVPSTSKEPQLFRSNVLLSSREDSVEESTQKRSSKSKTINLSRTEEKTVVLKNNKKPERVCTEKSYEKELNFRLCVVCKVSQKDIVEHIKVKHRDLPKRTLFRCDICYTPFFYESCLIVHKEKCKN